MYKILGKGKENIVCAPTPPSFLPYSRLFRAKCHFIHSIHNDQVCRQPDYDQQHLQLRCLSEDCGQVGESEEAKGDGDVERKDFPRSAPAHEAEDKDNNAQYQIDHINHIHNAPPSFIVSSIYKIP